MNLLVFIIALVSQGDWYYHFYWFFVIAIPFFFTDTIPKWLGWGDGLKPNLGNWIIVALSVLLFALLITYFIVNKNCNSDVNSQFRLNKKANSKEMKYDAYSKRKKPRKKTPLISRKRPTAKGMMRYREDHPWIKKADRFLK